MIGGGSKIYDTDFHSLSYIDRKSSFESNVLSKEIYIDDNVFIGAGSIILKGVRIGKNSVVGAGSVVRKNIPDNEVWFGNPAQFVRKVEAL
jgi:acetyltransferase-like isoleucine patch superfamily enzyme